MKAHSHALTKGNTIVFRNSSLKPHHFSSCRHKVKFGKMSSRLLELKLLLGCKVFTLLLHCNVKKFATGEYGNSWLKKGSDLCGTVQMDG